MKKFILIEVVERDIHTPELFETREAATSEMLSRLKSVMDLTDADLAAAEPCGEGFGEVRRVDDVYFDDVSASCERRGQNYDWNVFEI